MKTTPRRTGQPTNLYLDPQVVAQFKIVAGTRHTRSLSELVEILMRKELAAERRRKAP